MLTSRSMMITHSVLRSTTTSRSRAAAATLFHGSVRRRGGVVASAKTTTAIRSLSSAPASATTTAGNNAFADTAAAHRPQVTPAAQPSSKNPTLKKIPSLPIVGSRISAYSGIPAIELDNFVNWFRRVAKENGPFFSMGFPGFGSDNDKHGTTYIVRDPTEMLKVLKQEGKYPR